MKLMLVNPLHDPNDTRLWPPVGLGYLATAARSAGHQVTIVDQSRDCRTVRSFEATVREWAPDVVGFTAFTMGVPAVASLAKAVRNTLPGARIVIGGPHVSAAPESTFRLIPDADFGVQAEGETPLRMILDTLSRGQEPGGAIPGLVYRQGQEVRIVPPEVQHDIESYGLPAWDLIKPESYLGLFCNDDKTLPVFFSRGCPFPCTFCAARVTSGAVLRRRSLDNIFQELHMLRDTYGANRFIIEDEGFGTSKAFILAFCERLKSDGMNARFDFGVGLRLDQADEELLTALKAANFCRTIALGIESGSVRILKLMKKRTDLDLIRERVRLMDRMGFEPTGYFILGFPTETREEMEQTVQLALELPLREASFTAFQPLPGTEATQMLIDRGELPAGFDATTIKACAVTYAPEGMSTRELQNIRRRAILRFYLRPRVLWRMLISPSLFSYIIKRFFRIFFVNNAR
jgi:radical SAM superfamily enzyme YgiQ (UPF0313 family)